MNLTVFALEGGPKMRQNVADFHRLKPFYNGQRVTSIAAGCPRPPPPKKTGPNHIFKIDTDDLSYFEFSVKFKSNRNSKLYILRPEINDSVFHDFTIRYFSALCLFHVFCTFDSWASVFRWLSPSNIRKFKISLNYYPIFFCSRI